MPEREDYEVVVIGAGSAGSAAAVFLAEAGLSTGLVDARPLDQAGGRWVNAIPTWFFDRSGVGRPQPPEAVSPGKALVMCSVHRPDVFRIDPAPAPTVDMGRLVDRLHARARVAGVRWAAPVRQLRFSFEGERPVEMTALEDRGEEGVVPIRWRARLFVDASGLGGTLRHQAPALRRDCPVPEGGDLCAAIQEDCEVLDRQAARAFLEERRMVPGDVAGWVGVRGGFSTWMIHLHEEMDHAGILVGISGDGRHGTARQLLASKKVRYPFLGRGIRAGAGLIPVRRPFDRLVAPGVALLGDAACQVFPGHASGVGMGLLAARMLADACQDSPDPGALSCLWDYAARFQRTHGPLLAAGDAFRRMVWTLPERDVQALTDAGFVGPGSTWMALSQRLALPDFPGWNPASEGIRLLQGSLRRPDLAARILAVGARMAALTALYRGYPRAPDDRALSRWSRAVATVLGVQPDLR